MVAEAATAASAFSNCREKRGAVGGSESDGDDDSGGEGLGDGHGGVGMRARGLRADRKWLREQILRSGTNPSQWHKILRSGTGSSPRSELSPVLAVDAGKIRFSPPGVGSPPKLTAIPRSSRLERGSMLATPLGGHGAAFLLAERRSVFVERRMRYTTPLYDDGAAYV